MTAMLGARRVCGWFTVPLLLLGCSRATPSESQPAVSSAPSAATSAQPNTAPQVPTGAGPRRYWSRIPIPDDTEPWVVVLTDREVILLSLDSVRVLSVKNRTTAGRRTTLSVRSPVRDATCVLDEREGGHAEFRCEREAPYTLLEMDPKKEAARIAFVDQKITALTPAPGVCERAERCCVAAFPLLAPGQVCDVGFQLGPDRFPDTCVKVIASFGELLKAKRLELPPDCR